MPRALHHIQDARPHCRDVFSAGSLNGGVRPAVAGSGLCVGAVTEAMGTGAEMAFAAAGEKKIDPDDAGQVESLGHDEELLRQRLSDFVLKRRCIAPMDWPMKRNRPGFVVCARC